MNDNLHQNLSEEQQQLTAIKNWLSVNYWMLLGVIVIFCAVFFGPDFYRNYKNSTIYPASDAFEKYLAAFQEVEARGAILRAEDLENIELQTDALIESYGSSHYAFLASIKTAKIAASMNNIEVASKRLQWALHHSQNQADKLLVNLRLALLLAQQGKNDDALAILTGENQAFAALYAESRGDILRVSNFPGKALIEYETALAAITDNSQSALMQKNIIQAKLADLKRGLGSLQINSNSAQVKPRAG